MLKHFALIAIAVFLTAAAPIPKTSPSQPPIPNAAKAGGPPQNQPTSSTNQSAHSGDSPNNFPPGFNLTVSPHIEVKAPNESDKGDKKSASDLSLVIFTGGLLLAALLQWRAMTAQANIARDTLEEMKRSAATQGTQMERQLKIAEDNSKAATSSAQSAEHALAVVERSYISVDNWCVGNFKINNLGNAGVVFQMINSGRIPAEITEVLMKYVIAPNVPDVPDYTDATKGVHAVIRPGGVSTQPFRFSKIIEQIEFDKTIEREWCVFVWGKITYTDGFKKIHETGFGAKAICQDRDPEKWTFEFIGKPGYAFST